jgi:membrane-associated phospholipid phosphatase
MAMPRDGHDDFDGSKMIQARWRGPGLIACNLVALVLLASWRWPPARVLWDRLDVWAFHLLNAPLASNAAWAHVWAVGNMRLVDLLVFLIMLGFLVKENWIFSAAQVRRALYAFLAVLFLLLLMRSVLFTEVVKIMHWQRASPSLTVDGAVRLVDLFPDWSRNWHMKDASGRSFPGDHASVLLTWAIFLSPFARGWRRWLVWSLALLFMLPRLVSGAHWLSDVVVGGSFLGLLAIGWGLYTPYAAKACSLLERFGTPVLQCLGRLPGLRHISLLSGR